MVSVNSLLKEVERLEASQEHVSKLDTSDPLEFARSAGIEPDPWQERVLLSDHDRILMCCSRQSGKSTVAAVLAAHEALTNPGSLTLIVAPSERQARETFTKSARVWRCLGQPIPADSDRKLGVELRNGSRIEALPGAETTVRGYSGVDLLLCDEAARVSDELYFAVRPMLSVSRGRLVLMSTPNGKRGAFYEAWENGGTEWERYRVTAEECPRISPEFLASERRSMPSYVFEQEYMCVFGEVDEAVFTHEMVMGAVSDEVAPLSFGGDAW